MIQDDITQAILLRIDQLLHMVGEEVYWDHRFNEQRIWVRFDEVVHNAWASLHHLIQIGDIITRVDQDRNQETRYRVSSIVKNFRAETQSLLLAKL